MVSREGSDWVKDGTEQHQLAAQGKIKAAHLDRSFGIGIPPRYMDDTLRYVGERYGVWYDVAIA